MRSHILRECGDCIIEDSRQNRQLLWIANAAVVMYDAPGSTTYDRAAGLRVAFCPETEGGGYQLDGQLIQQLGRLTPVLSVIYEPCHLFDLKLDASLKILDMRIAARTMHDTLYSARFSWARLGTRPHWDHKKPLARRCR